MINCTIDCLVSRRQLWYPIALIGIAFAVVVILLQKNTESFLGGETLVDTFASSLSEEDKAYLSAFKTTGILNVSKSDVNKSSEPQSAYNATIGKHSLEFNPKPNKIQDAGHKHALPLLSIKLKNSENKFFTLTIDCREEVVEASIEKDAAFVDSLNLVRYSFIEDKWYKKVYPASVVKSFRIVTDEESVASWFLDHIDKNTDSAGGLSKRDRQRVLECISTLLKFRLAGQSSLLSTERSLKPSSMTMKFAVYMWTYGSDNFGSCIQFWIFVLIVYGVLLAILGFVFVDDCLYRKRLHAVCDYVEFALPALGFVGTIVGLGSAFGSVGIVSAIELLKKLTLIEVLLSLGTAFSTTLWGLVGSLITKKAFLFNNWLEAPYADSEK